MSGYGNLGRPAADLGGLDRLQEREHVLVGERGEAQACPAMPMEWEGAEQVYCSVKKSNGCLSSPSPTRADG